MFSLLSGPETQPEPRLFTACLTVSTLEKLKKCYNTVIYIYRTCQEERELGG